MRQGSQRLQYPLIKAYTSNYSRIPSMIKGIFLNEKILESPHPKPYSSLIDPFKGTLGIP